MAIADHVGLADAMAGVARRNPGQTDVIEAVQGVAEEVFGFIADRCLTWGQIINGYVDEVKGANIAGCKKVADAMLAFGVV